MGRKGFEKGQWQTIKLVQAARRVIKKVRDIDPFNSHSKGQRLQKETVYPFVVYGLFFQFVIHADDFKPVVYTPVAFTGGCII